jgi:DNA topoisomerase-1
MGIKCPKCKEANVTSRVSKRGKAFYGCSGYPKCDFVSWDKPIAKTCPQCQSPYLLEKYSKKAGKSETCPKEECGYKHIVEEADATAGAEA